MSKELTGLIAFTVSAIFHELVIALPLKSTHMPLAFLAMMAQVGECGRPRARLAASVPTPHRGTGPGAPHCGRLQGAHLRSGPCGCAGAARCRLHCHQL
eukprot:scaffold4525_cov125-Isochrysis_galbana.AAC.6